MSAATPRPRQIRANRLAPDDALVDQMKLSVRARADDAARIEDLIARPKERSLWSRLNNDACRIVADHFAAPGGGAAVERTL